MGNAMINSDKDGCGLVGDMFKGLVVGAAAGAGGAWVGGAVAGALKFGGFASGFLSGAAGGGASGFVNSAGNAWTSGADFGQGLKAGLIGGGLGALSGGVIGGIASGISSSLEGYSFWDGSRTDQFVIGSSQYEQIANNYNSSSQANTNDDILKIRMMDEFGISEGCYNIQAITTKTGRGFGMTNSGRYVNLKTNELVGSYVRHFTTGYSDLHVSAYYTLCDAVAFRAISGHELIHAYHYFAIQNVVSKYSEMGAYKYTYDVYMKNGQITSGLFTMYNSMAKGFWGSYPSQYQIPMVLRLFPH